MLPPRIFKLDERGLRSASVSGTLQGGTGDSGTLREGKGELRGGTGDSGTPRGYEGVSAHFGKV